MKIQILVDNRTGKGFAVEHGLSIYIEAGINILFDTGQSDLFIKNAHLLGINIDAVNHIVLSHGHHDHGDGLSHLNTKGLISKSLIAHPTCFAKRYKKKDGTTYCGLDENALRASRDFSLELHTEPYWLSDDIVFLGQIPRTIAFEAMPSSFVDEKGQEDIILDDSALVFRLPKGLVVISGCAHSGICNIVSHAVKITGISTVLSVVGGLHLNSLDRRSRCVIDALKNAGVTEVVPLHCTNGDAYDEIRRTFGSRTIGAGDQLLYI